MKPTSGVRAKVAAPAQHGRSPVTAWLRLALAVFGLAALLWGALPGRAQAASGGTVHQASLVTQKDTVIRQGQTLEDVLVIGHNAQVAGRVTEVLVVADGNLVLGPTANVGTVVDLGGSIERAPGARVRAVYSVSLHTPFWGGALFGSVFAALLWAGLLVAGVCLVVLSLLVTLAMKSQMFRALAEVERSVRRTGVIGVLVSLGLLAIAALFAVTIVGLPLTGLVLLFYLAIGVVGFSIMSQWLGKLALRYAPIERPPWLKSVVGSVLAVAFFSIPYVGLVMFLLVWLAGVGAVTAWLWQAWRYRRSTPEERAFR